MLRFAALSTHRWLNPIGLVGPRSTGKTELARRIAAALGVPVIQLSETNLTSAEDLAQELERSARDRGDPMRVYQADGGGQRMRCPPTVVFIDEVHLLGRRIQDALLTATEPDDRTLIARGRTIDTSQVTFLMATTDVGRLREAFRSRLTLLELSEYTVPELVEILRSHRGDRRRFPDAAEELGDEALAAIGVAGRLVPRQALQLLRDVSEAVALGDAQPSAEGVRSYLYATRTVDASGLTQRDYRYLGALYPDRRKGVESLAVELGEDPTTVEYEIEPYLIRQGFVERHISGRMLSSRGQAFYGEYRRRATR
jgi:Holliday junction resolvasome RuvABC ATP-dependent DNA helicase subunit